MAILWLFTRSRYLPNPVLREKAKRVPKIDASIHRLIEDMIDSMYEANGVGLAAPQIGVSLRVVVIGLPEEEPFALINPEIVKVSGERQWTRAASRCRAIAPR